VKIILDKTHTVPSVNHPTGMHIKHANIETRGKTRPSLINGE